MPPPGRFRPGGRKKPFEYIPAPSTGAHTILVSMLKAEQNELIKNLTKQQVLDYCARYSQSGLRDTNKTWSYMKGLVDKSLIGRHISRDPVYFLSDDGRGLAKKLVAIDEGKAIDDSDTGVQDETSRDSVVSQGPLSSQQSNSMPVSSCNDRDVSFVLRAGTYDIILVTDQREKIQIINLDSSIKMQTRTLSCGDFIWIARPKDLDDYDKTRDLVLDYVVERKRLDDLQQSIFDGRFEQQKLRLKNSGLRRPMYLIEETGKLRETNLTSAGLAQAVVSILINDGIDVEKVKSIQHANDYLIGMTKCLCKFYENVDLVSCSQERLKSGEAEKNEMMTYSEFQTKGAKIKNWTVREMFAKHLIQIRGVSDKVVAVIIKQYPTMSHLIDAYRKCPNEKAREGLLAKMPIPLSNRTVGPAISKRVYACYAMPSDLRNDLVDNDDFN